MEALFPHVGICVSVLRRPFVDGGAELEMTICELELATWPPEQLPCMHSIRETPVVQRGQDCLAFRRRANTCVALVKSRYISTEEYERSSCPVERRIMTMNTE